MVLTHSANFDGGKIRIIFTTGNRFVKIFLSNLSSQHISYESYVLSIRLSFLNALFIKFLQTFHHQNFLLHNN